MGSKPDLILSEMRKSGPTGVKDAKLLMSTASEREEIESSSQKEAMVTRENSGSLPPSLSPLQKAVRTFFFHTANTYHNGETKAQRGPRPGSDHTAKKWLLLGLWGAAQSSLLSAVYFWVQDEENAQYPSVPDSSQRRHR